MNKERTTAMTAAIDAVISEHVGKGTSYLEIISALVMSLSKLAAFTVTQKPALKTEVLALTQTQLDKTPELIENLSLQMEQDNASTH